ncbi:hypothetical protein SAMN05216199_3967 [Pedococcus cremeus]|uniref:Uncharacterized protein n=1 Tax=Pedococcus cremeus TaxID=587636 RepID=A0A1H9XL30_9MICO|nr:hypothetical protein SAMN05216199_3967 [Pedococcus cremeus]
MSDSLEHVARSTPPRAVPDGYRRGSFMPSCEATNPSRS